MTLLGKYYPPTPRTRMSSLGFRNVCLFLVSIWSLVSAGTTAFYADNGLQQTVLLEQLPARQRKEMQQEILTLLGLHHRPKPQGLVGAMNSAPKFMLDLYKTLYIEGKEEELTGSPFHRSLNMTQFGPIDSRSIDGSDIIMSFVNHAGKIHHLRHEQQKTFFFDLSEVSPGEVVKGAELRVYKEKSDDMRHERLRIEVFRIHQGPDPEEKILESESNTTVYGEDEGWFDLNVTRATSLWAADAATNLGLYVRILDAKGHELDLQKAGLVGRKGPADKQSFMVGYFKMVADVHPRHTRSVKPRPNQELSYRDQPYYHSAYNSFRQKACQRKSLYVSFRDLGWQDWILAPEGYSAFYCDGECSFPLGAHMNATNHAIVQTLLHLLDPFVVPKPCCAPTKVSAISVLYFDHQSNVIMKKYKDMIVKSCGCR